MSASHIFFVFTQVDSEGRDLNQVSFKTDVVFCGKRVQIREGFDVLPDDKIIYCASKYSYSGNYNELFIRC